MTKWVMRREGIGYVRALRRITRDIQKRMQTNPDLFWEWRRVFVAGNTRQRMKWKAEKWTKSLAR